MSSAGLQAGFAEPLLSLPALALLIVLALPIAAFVGFHVGHLEYRRRGYENVPPDRIPGGTSLGAMLALLGLLLGFCFSSALNWREGRQMALVEEAAAIGSAFMSADLLADPGRTAVQEAILNYAKTRLATEDDIRSSAAFSAFLDRTLAAQTTLWPTTRSALNAETSDPVRTFVARSVMDMLDAHTRRIAAASEQIPPPAKLMVVLASTAAIFIVGNRTALQGRKLTWRTFFFAGLLVTVIIIIFDLDRSLEGTMKVKPDTMLSTIAEMQSALQILSD